MQTQKLEITPLYQKTIDLNFEISESSRHSSFSKEWSEYLKIILHGKHSVLFLAPEKTKFLDLFENLFSYQKEYKTFVGFNELINIKQAKSALKDEKVFKFSEGGVAFFKEFFKFSEDVIKIFLDYKKKQNSYKANELIYLAQSSICPCGKARLNAFRNCKYSLKRCRSLIINLKERDLDQFDLIFPVPTLNRSEDLFDHLYLENIQESLNKAKIIQKKRKQEKANRSLMVYELKEKLSHEIIDFNLLPRDVSYELLKNTLAVARTIADLKNSEIIEIEHLERAKRLCMQPRRKLKQII